jgi:Short C-terminal domain
MNMRFSAAVRLSARVAPHFQGIKMRPWLMGITGITAVPLLAAMAAIALFVAWARARATRHERPTEVAGTLSQLKSLHDSGDLSDAEYQRERDRVLVPA